MQRLSGGKKAVLLELIRKGVSINKIAKRSGLAKSTIYYHYKKALGKKYKEPEFEVAFSELEGETTGIFAGDGSLHYSKSNWQYEVNVHFGKEKYALYVKELFERRFNKKFRLQKETLNRLRLRTQDRKIFNAFYNYLDFERTHKHDTVKLKKLDFSKEFNIGFLRGLLDTDGTACHTKQGRVITYYTTSLELAKQIKSLLLGLNMETGWYEDSRPGYKTLYHVKIRKKDNDRFLGLIKPFKAMN